MGADYIVIGGGMVGAAIGCGLARAGARVLMLDEGDRAFRAARGNFGLVWVQSKGLGAPHYTRWSLHSAGLWPGFAAALAEEVGVDVHHRRPGGLSLCLDEAEYEARAGMMAQHRRELGGTGLDARMLRRPELAEMLPGIGPTVAGASFTPCDGTANPLALLRALHAAFAARGGRYLPGRAAAAIETRAGIFRVRTAAETYEAAGVVIAAGLGTRALAAPFGLDLPIAPQRGQILVTERMAPFLAWPTQGIRQTVEGSVIIGNSAEDAGFDDRTRAPVMAGIAARAVASFPALADARIVRAWGALRILTPDGLPIYARAPDHPGLHAAVCHSGVTLAAAHERDIADWIAGAAPRPADTVALDLDRFDVQAAAD